MSKLHLITQNNQPYGSARRCCERCGLAVFAFPPGDKYTDREVEFTKEFAKGYKLRLCFQQGEE